MATDMPLDDGKHPKSRPLRLYLPADGWEKMGGVADTVHTFSASEMDFASASFNAHSFLPSVCLTRVSLLLKLCSHL